MRWQPLAADPVFSIEIEGGRVEGAVWGSRGARLGSKSPSPTTATRSWFVPNRQLDEVLPEAAAQLRAAGATIDRLRCSPDQAEYQGSKDLRRGRAAGLSVRGRRHGPTCSFTVTLSVGVFGGGPWGSVGHRTPLEAVEGDCPPPLLAALGHTPDPP